MADTRLTAGADAYGAKSERYFGGVREDILAHLRDSEKATGLTVLEIGCGDGSTGRAALERGIASAYHGVELFPDAAARAREALTSLTEGDVEKLDLPWTEPTFDAVVASEVLEHLADPWAVVRRLSALIKPGGLFFASSPNVCHHKVVRMLLRGGWDLADQGTMDRTHLRWFTPRTYAEMFESAGLQVESVKPLDYIGPKARAFMMLTPPKRRVIFWRQINLRARMPGGAA